jgi:prepilin-type processing-associated H-X9-DG protein
MVSDLGVYSATPNVLRRPDVVSAGDSLGKSGDYIPGTGPGSTTNRGAVTFAASISDLDNDYKTGRHFEGVNMLFADGHVKWLKSHTVWTEANKCSTTACDTPKTAWNPLVDNS